MRATLVHGIFVHATLGCTAQQTRSVCDSSIFLIAQRKCFTRLLDATRHQITSNNWCLHYSTPTQILARPCFRTTVHFVLFSKASTQLLFTRTHTEHFFPARHLRKKNIITLVCSWIAITRLFSTKCFAAKVLHNQTCTRQNFYTSYALNYTSCFKLALPPQKRKTRVWNRVDHPENALSNEQNNILSVHPLQSLEHGASHFFRPAICALCPGFESMRVYSCKTRQWARFKPTPDGRLESTAQRGPQQHQGVRSCCRTKSSHSKILCSVFPSWSQAPYLMKLDGDVQILWAHQLLSIHALQT